MTRTKRKAVELLSAGLLLAVGTPLYLAGVGPHLAGYLLHPVILLGQAVPYVVCAGLWLPWRAPGAAKTALILGGLLLVSALVLYLPMLWTAGARGGDMIGLGFMLISIGTTLGVLAGSAVAALVLWLRLKKRPAVVA